MSDNFKSEIMKKFIKVKIVMLFVLLCYCKNIQAQESDVPSFLRDHLMIYYVENPSGDEYVLINPNELTSGNSLFGNNPQMDVAQNMLREIFSPSTDTSFRERVVEILGRYSNPVALFLYYESGPLDEASATANWTNCIESGQFSACVTVEAGDEYAGIIHYGSSEINSEGLLAAKSHFLQLLSDVATGIDLTRSFADITSSTIARARSVAHVPEGGFPVQRQGRTVNFDISIRRLQQLREHLQNPEVITHIQNTLSLFDRETGSAHQSRDQVDMALVLAIATRESGVRLPLSRSTRRIVSAGRDAHTRGESGLDFLYDRRSAFPQSLRDQVIRVEGNPDVPGTFRRDTHPAYIREQDVLASFIIEIKARKQFFLRQFERVFSDEGGFTEEQRAALIANMSNEANRAWIQAAFGSRLRDILTEVRTLVRRHSNFDEVLTDNTINLNAIVTNDGIMPTNLSRQRTRLSLAESIIVESFLSNNL